MSTTSTTQALADAITAALNSAEKPEHLPPFFPTWSYVPSFDVQELKTLRVTLRPHSRTFTRQARKLTTQSIVLELAIQQHTRDAEQLNKLAALVDWLADWLLSPEMPAAVEEVEQVVFFDDELHRKTGVFESVLSFEAYPPQ
jgi:hypothetical protein